MQHTQGKWVVEGEPAQKYRASFTVVSSLDKKSICAISSSQTRSNESKEANAHLIAAAPALFDALERMVKHLADLPMGENEGLTAEIRQQAIYAINQARNVPEDYIDPFVATKSAGGVVGKFVEYDGNSWEVIQQGVTRQTDGLTYIKLKRDVQLPKSTRISPRTSWQWVDLKSARVIPF